MFRAIDSYIHHRAHMFSVTSVKHLILMLETVACAHFPYFHFHFCVFSPPEDGTNKTAPAAGAVLFIGRAS